MPMWKSLKRKMSQKTMKIANLEDTIINKIKAAREDTELKLFKAFKNSLSSSEREAIFAKQAVLREVTNTLINNISKH